ncbi:MAG: DUF3887 domain-containing protein [Eubacteriales bacterium]|nr:DUF3887 domain-containing protein [Eubacteriales bacterium]
MKKNLKRFITIALVLALGMSMFGCAANSLPEGFEEDEVGTAAEEIVGLATAGDYESIIFFMRDDLKSAVTAAQLEEGWASIYEKAGAFQKISKTAFSSVKDETTGEEYAVVQVLVKHKSANLVYTISFDNDLALVGLYLK